MIFLIINLSYRVICDNSRLHLRREFHSLHRNSITMLCLCTVIVFLVSLFFIIQKDKPPIFGIYTERGRWYYLKYIVFGIIFHLRRVIFIYKIRKYITELLLMLLVENEA